ncbi:peptidylprolyl isomerase [Marinicella gelatinilytica]|uniref:peptidylprolyl isomerase n=1 Tax=Marinicella gelatinilytica TaxID=2996017 RepID=UPI002260AAC6|nr:peptidylprolyl isomerase [Marinicella gelatinilytica]MCX7544074.1 peptidylprolyl isomerase [Marinicella gelatinilytica]
MYYILLFVLMLQQQEVLLQQGGVKVKVSDIDVYVHNIPEEYRGDFASNHKSIERDVYDILNFKIHLDYIYKNNINESIDKFYPYNNQSEVHIDEDFINKLKIDRDLFKKQYEMYLYNKNLYTNYKKWFMKQLNASKLEQLAFDKYKVNKSKKYIIPEKRNLSLIMLNDNYGKSEVIELLSIIAKNDTEKLFSQFALDYSEDNTVKHNNGNLGWYSKEGFKFPFSNVVFESSLGTIRQVFYHDNKYFIVRVNEIQEPKFVEFNEVKPEIISNIQEQLFKNNQQKIIDEQSVNKLIINDDIVQDFLDRYTVFIN